MKLRDALGEFSQGWRDDLTAQWQALLAGVEPNSTGVADTLTFDPLEPIYPSRRSSPLPGARSDAHVFRAFDSLAPSNVRCVLIGQDPYPKLSRATGRSFEQGDLDHWTTSESQVAASLRALLRMLVVTRSANSDALTMKWSSLVAQVGTSPIQLEGPIDLFDHLQSQGVLCLNAALTITRFKTGGAPEQTRGHLPYWRPVIGQVLRSIAVRASGHVVFLCLGQFAQNLLTSERVKKVAASAGTWGVRAVDVSLPHPVAPGFLHGRNPFLAVNERLTAMGASQIGW